MSKTSISNVESEFCGQFMILGLKTDKNREWPNAHVFFYRKEYLLIPNCQFPRNPVKKYKDCEFEKELPSFIECVKKNLSKETVTFSNRKPMTYNIKNGLVAIYTHDRVEVTKITFMWEKNLKTLGYIRDSKLLVPLASQEIYYDETRDELLAVW